ncbi:MAG TPA: sugar phosphate nucleotidyltransferase [Longimicrobiales bacterium]|nr:sugar phosphate nucleotidyltransferase [Longimicrobiales bacterium]
MTGRWLWGPGTSSPSPSAPRSSLPESTSSWGTDPHLWVTILAGGVGSRFWPVSTPARPKQLLPLASDRPLMQDTVGRALRLTSPERIRVLTGEHLLAPFRQVVEGLPPGAYLVEPEARGTAPVLAWAAWTLHREDPEAVLVSLHADHLVEPEEAFLALLREGTELARREGALVTVGATPDRPETGYGYIQPGDSIPGPPTGSAWVAAFHEKPDAVTAADYLARGFLWNTGIFLWRADVFLDEIRNHAPEVARALPHLEGGDVAGFFRECENISVDVAVLERSRRVAVIPCTFRWDDVGSWASLPRTRPADALGNVAVGECHALDSHRNVVFAEGAPVVLFGVDDLIVVRTRGVTFVARAELASELKRLVGTLPPDLQNPPV